MKTIANKNQLPSYCQKYFWDVNWKKLDYKKYSYFVIERLLEYGNILCLKWMFKQYSIKEIKQVIINSRNTSLKSALFWADFLKVDKSKIICLKKPFLSKQKAVWPY